MEAAVAAIERAPIASTDLVPGRVFRKNGDQNKGFVDLYRKVQNFWRDCERDIATDEGRARLTEAKTIMAQMIGIVRGLREGPTAAIRTKALAILFPNTNIYDVYLDTATNKRYDPIVWVTRDVTVSTKTFTLVDWAATNAKNPQLMEPFMSAQLKERMTWFNTDDERGGARRANDGRNPDVRNHLSVVEAVKECQACLIAPAT